MHQPLSAPRAAPAHPFAASRWMPLQARWRGPALLAALFTLAGCATTAPQTPPSSGAALQPSAATGAITARTAPAPARPASDVWAPLQADVGRHPGEGGTDFLRTGPMAERIKGLLGPVNYPVLLQNMGASGPLQRDGGLLYIVGNRPHQGGSEAAAVVLDPARDAMRVWLQTGDEQWDVQDAGPAVALPADVRRLIDNARR